MFASCIKRDPKYRAVSVKKGPLFSPRIQGSFEFLGKKLHSHRHRAHVAFSVHRDASKKNMALSVKRAIDIGLF